MRHCIMVYGLVFCIVMNYMGFGWYPLCLVLLYPGVGMRCFLFRFLGWLRTWLSGNRCATWFCRSWSFCCLDCPSIFLGLFLRIFFRFCLSVSVGLFAVSLCFFLCISLSSSIAILSSVLSSAPSSVVSVFSSSDPELTSSLVSAIDHG